MKKNFICVFDLETDSPEPLVCEPIQITSVILHPHTLEVISDSMFNSDVQPPNIEDENYYETHKETIYWHSKNRKTDPKSLFEQWVNFPKQNIVWKQWKSYLRKWHIKQTHHTMFSAPIRAGHNIREFDNIIMDRLCTRYKDVQKNGEQKIFCPRDVIDIKELAFYWFENLREPEAYNMHDLRLFFGIPTSDSHEGIKDVKDEAWMISKFLKLHRTVSPKVRFKNSYVGSN